MIVEHVRSSEIDDCDRLEISRIVRESFVDPVHLRNLETSLWRRFEPTTKNAVVVRDHGRPLAFAFTTTRRVRALAATAQFLSVGSVAVQPESRGKGLGRLLIRGLVELAQVQRCAGLYLQGIPNFYSRLGFYPYMARSEISIASSSFEQPSRTMTRPMLTSDLETVSSLFERQARNNVLTAIRTLEDWSWLVNHATSSYFFYQPRVITQSDAVVGYFTSDPDNPCRIREFVTSGEPEVVLDALSAIATHCRKESSDPIRVMTPRNSLACQVLHEHLTGDFIEHVQRNGGQLMYLVDPVSSLLSTLSEVLSGTFTSRIVSGGHIQIEKPSGRAILKLASAEVAPFLAKYRDRASWLDAEVRWEFESQTKGAVPFVYQGDNL